MLSDKHRNNKYISHDDHIIYNLIRKLKDGVINYLTIAQLHWVIELKADVNFLHNIYKVLFQAIYHQENYRLFPHIYHPCNRIAIITTPTILENQCVISITHTILDVISFITHQNNNNKSPLLSLYSAFHGLSTTLHLTYIFFSITITLITYILYNHKTTTTNKTKIKAFYFL